MRQTLKFWGIVGFGAVVVAAVGGLIGFDQSKPHSSLPSPSQSYGEQVSTVASQLDEALPVVYVPSTGGVYVKTLRELVDIADAIVIGDVLTSIEVQTDTGGDFPGTSIRREIPFTISQVRADKVLKGTTDSIVEVTQFGGKHVTPGGTQIVVDETNPLLRVGERYLLFLDSSTNNLGSFWVIGPRGLFAVKQGRLSSPLPAKLLKDLLGAVPPDPVIQLLSGKTEAEAVASIQSP